MKAILTTLLLTAVISGFAQTNVPNPNAAAVIRAAANDPLQPIRAGIKIREDRRDALLAKLSELDGLIQQERQRGKLAASAGNQKRKELLDADAKRIAYSNQRKEAAKQCAALQLEIADLRKKYNLPETSSEKKPLAKK